MAATLILLRFSFLFFIIRFQSFCLHSVCNGINWISICSSAYWFCCLIIDVENELKSAFLTIGMLSMLSCENLGSATLIILIDVSNEVVIS